MKIKFINSGHALIATQQSSCAEMCKVSYKCVSYLRWFSTLFSNPKLIKSHDASFWLLLLKFHIYPNSITSGMKIVGIGNLSTMKRRKNPQSQEAVKFMFYIQQLYSKRLFFGPRFHSPYIPPRIHKRAIRGHWVHPL